MCAFLCIALPYNTTDVVEAFGRNILLEEATTTPIGRATCGNRSGSTAYVLTQGGCSCSLVGNSHRKEISHFTNS